MASGQMPRENAACFAGEMEMPMFPGEEVGLFEAKDALKDALNNALNVVGWLVGWLVGRSVGGSFEFKPHKLLSTPCLSVYEG